jgi:hypothetical protein
MSKEFPKNPLIKEVNLTGYSALQLHGKTVEWQTFPGPTTRPQLGVFQVSPPDAKKSAVVCFHQDVPNTHLRHDLTQKQYNSICAHPMKGGVVFLIPWQHPAA